MADFTITEADEPLIAKLSEEHRQALRSEGSYKVRAEALGLPIGTVKSRLNRARLALASLRDEARAPQ